MFARPKTMKSGNAAILLYQWPPKIFFCLHCTRERLCVTCREQFDRNKTVQAYLNDLFMINSALAEISSKVSQTGVEDGPS